MVEVETAALLAMDDDELIEFVTNKLRIPLLGAVTRTHVLSRVLSSSREYREGSL